MGSEVEEEGAAWWNRDGDGACRSDGWLGELREEMGRLRGEKGGADGLREEQGGGRWCGEGGMGRERG